MGLDVIFQQIIDMLVPHFTFQAIVVALFLNIFVNWIKDLVERLHGGKALPFRRQIFFGLVFVLGAAFAVIGCKTGLLTCEDDKPGVMGMWYATLATLLYSVGIKDLINYLRTKLSDAIKPKEGGK
mgnify:CR=1 FL=1